MRKLAILFFKSVPLRAVQSAMGPVHSYGIAIRRGNHIRGICSEAQEPGRSSRSSEGVHANVVRPFLRPQRQTRGQPLSCSWRSPFALDQAAILGACWLVWTSVACAARYFLLPTPAKYRLIKRE